MVVQQNSEFTRAISRAIIIASLNKRGKINLFPMLFFYVDFWARSPVKVYPVKWKIVVLRKEITT